MPPFNCATASPQISIIDFYKHKRCEIMCMRYKKKSSRSTLNLRQVTLMDWKVLRVGSSEEWFGGGRGKEEVRERCMMKRVMIFTIRKILSKFSHQEYEMGVACDTHDLGCKCVYFSYVVLKVRWTGKPNCKWNDNSWVWKWKTRTYKTGRQTNIWSVLVPTHAPQFYFID